MPVAFPPSIKSYFHTGQRWQALTEAEKAKYKSGLTCLAVSSGKGGMRTWVPTSTPPLLLTPTTTAAVAMTQLNERRLSNNQFTATPMPPRPPTASPAASPAVPYAPTAALTIPLSGCLKQKQPEPAEGSSDSVWQASGVSQ
jgi:hypothetical protein